MRGLEEYFSKAPAETLGQCDICHGWSPVIDGIDACPYCDDQDAKASDSEGANAYDKAVAELLPGETESIDALAIEASGVELLPPATGKRTKLAANEVADRKKVAKAPATPKPSSPALGLASGLRAPGSGEKELDESLARYKLAAENGADSLYLMGVEIRRQRDHLWQQRMEAGKPKYKTWNQFVAAEHDISTSLANRTMRVVENFSRAQFHQYGAKALMVLVGAPKEEHAALLAQADAGATTRELEVEVKKIRERDGITVIETGRTAEAAATGRKVPTAKTTAAAAAARKREPAAITVGLKSEQATIDMFARTNNNGEKREARTLEDQPYGILECMNGVNLYFALKQHPSGKIQIKLTAKRPEEDE